ncbi:hypothetical protein FKP32DRAFT_966616 [Trametes sanguinea]|nr:hypothetical protein FKP32DRAFT_966616 [Trametes sanguinea]
MWAGYRRYPRILTHYRSFPSAPILLPRTSTRRRSVTRVRRGPPDCRCVRFLSCRSRITNRHCSSQGGVFCAGSVVTTGPRDFRRLRCAVGMPFRCRGRLPQEPAVGTLTAAQLCCSAKLHPSLYPVFTQGIQCRLALLQIFVAVIPRTVCTTSPTHALWGTYNTRAGCTSAAVGRDARRTIPSVYPQGFLKDLLFSYRTVVRLRIHCTPPAAARRVRNLPFEPRFQ